MRNVVEIQKAHDILAAVITGNGIGCNDYTRDLAVEANLALAWVLGHKHGSGFAKNLQRIEETLEEVGLTMVRLEDLETTTGKERDAIAKARAKAPDLEWYPLPVSSKGKLQ